MTNVLLPGATIGIIGAGQLGKMLGQSASKMGYKVAMLDSQPTACGFSVSNWYTVADFADQQAVADFVKRVDVVTYEFENINAQVLDALAQKANMPQSTQLLATSQHRLREKEALNHLGIPTVTFAKVTTLDELATLSERIGFPCVLKTTRFGYDGKGQCVLQSALDLTTKIDDLSSLLQNECVLEAFCNHQCEVSVMVCRDEYGTVRTFPLSWNQHQAGVLFSSFAPAQVSDNVCEQVNAMACQIATSFDLIGLCGIECFVTADEQVFVNELAPRPHNSGHYTMESCNFSQYDAHILAITGRPLPTIEQQMPALMINILGQHLPMLPQLLTEQPQAMYHLYDKVEGKAQRKMGHLTWVDQDPNALLQKLDNDMLRQWKELFNQ